MRLFWFYILALSACASPFSTPPSYRLDNGKWLDGAGFTEKTAYIVDGRLSFSAPDGEAENIIDLEGGHVVPPYCEGHNHNLGGSADGVAETVNAYLADGVYYVMIQGSFRLYRDAIESALNTPQSVDVAFANNGVTGPGGHPRGLRESLKARFGLYPEFSKEELADVGYFEAETLAHLEEKWALVLAEKPDFIKAMLYFSEDYEARKDDPDYFGQRGLNPALLPVLAEMARAAGLRLAVHVETDADMNAALRAGAEIIAHLPSNDSAAKLSDETISFAAASGAAIITTFTVAKRFETRAPNRYAATLEAQRDNLARLQEAGATLVLGSDNVRDTSVGEAQHLANLGILSNRALLDMWTKNCAQTVFPDRKIGRLADGYEASFLVLGGDPLTDFNKTQDITLRFKDGMLLKLANETAAVP